MKVRVVYRSRGWGRVRPIFHVRLDGEYIIIIGNMRFRCTLKRHAFKVKKKGAVYTYYGSTVDCRRCRQLCETLRSARPKEVEVVKPLPMSWKKGA